MGNKNKQERKELLIDELLSEESFDWKDIVIFALDDHLQRMLEQMVSMGDLPNMSENEVYEMADLIENRTRNAIGKPLQKI